MMGLGDAKRWDLAVINHGFEMTRTRFKNWLAIAKQHNHDFDFETTTKRFKNWVAIAKQQNHDFDFETTTKRFKNWIAIAKKRLPTITDAALGAFLGYGASLALSFYSEDFIMNIKNICLFFNIFQPSPQSQFLSCCGGYKPLVESFIFQGFPETTNLFAIMIGCNASISFAMKTIRDKEDDVHTSMVAGFGYGVVISLYTGVRGPSVMSAGVIFALLNAGMHKAGIDVFKLIHIDLDNQTRDYLKDWILLI